MSRRTRREPDESALRAMPLARRYDAVRDEVEHPEGRRVCLLDWAPLVVRRTMGPAERLKARGPWEVYGHADRWSYDPATAEPREPARSASSPDALYRLLHFVGPRRFALTGKDDYYDGTLFRFWSPDRRYGCHVTFRKCELSMVFVCPQRDLFIAAQPTFVPVTPWVGDAPPVGEAWDRFLAMPGNREAFRAWREAEDAYRDQGLVVPWASARVKCKRRAGQAWMRLVVAIANSPVELESGDDFVV